MFKSAILSDDKAYRYQLSRSWDDEKESVLFIMLNPSTADSNIDDPTIRRVVNFAKTWGFGSVHVANLYAFRSTDPKGLKNVFDPVGSDNIEYVRELVGKVNKVVYAWGNKKTEPEWLREIVNIPYCIDVSINNIPKHPLFLKKTMELKEYERI